MIAFLSQWSGVLDDHELRSKLLGTLFWIVLLIAGRTLTQRALRVRHWPSDKQRLMWHVRANQVFALLLFLGLVFVWAAQIEALALSAVAVAAALALATKELLMCLTGSVVRASSQSYTVGDRVEIGTYRGDVIDYGMLTTTILETGPAHQRTGRAITIPNSLLLTQGLVNETFTHDFVLHAFSVPVAVEQLDQAQEMLSEIAIGVCEEFQDEATRHMQEVSRQHGLAAPTTTPRVLIRLDDKDSGSLLVRVPSPAREKGRVEQSIVRGFLSRMAAARAASPPDAPSA